MPYVVLHSVDTDSSMVTVFHILCCILQMGMCVEEKNDPVEEQDRRREVPG